MAARVLAAGNRHQPQRDLAPCCGVVAGDLDGAAHGVLGGTPPLFAPGRIPLRRLPLARAVVRRQLLIVLPVEADEQAATLSAAFFGWFRSTPVGGAGQVLGWTRALRPPGVA